MSTPQRTDLRKLGSGIRLGTKPVVFTRYEPMVRKY